MLKTKNDPSLDEVCEGMGSVSHIPVPTGIINAGRSLVTFAYSKLCCKKKAAKPVEVSKLSTAVEASENSVGDTAVSDVVPDAAPRSRTSPYPARPNRTLVSSYRL